MSSAPNTRRRALLLSAGAAFAVLAGGLALLTEDAPRTEVEVDARRHASPTTPATAELTDVGREVLRSVSSAPGSNAPDGASAAEDEPSSDGASAHGPLVLPGGFPEPTTLEVHAWPILDDGSGEFDDGGRAPFARLAGRVADGTWRFDDLAPGRWVFVGSAAADGRSALGLSDEIKLLPGTSNGPIGIVLEEYAIEGRVLDIAGAPIEGVTVVHAWSPTDWRTAAVAPARFRIGDREETMKDLRETLSEIVVDAADIEPFIEQVDDEMLADFADRLKTRPAEFSEAWVLDLVDAWSARLAPDLQEPDDANSVVTDASGAFRLRFDGPGVVELWIAPSVHPTSADGTRWIAAPVREELVASGSLVARDVVLDRAARIEGIVKRPGGEAAPDSYVFVLPLGDGGIDVPHVSSDGRFLVNDVKPGQYLVGANEEIPGQGSLTWCELVEVEDGGEVSVQGVLAPAATVRGVIVDAEGLPVGDLELRARGLDVDHFVRNATTDAAGRFELPKLYPWRFTIEGVEREIVGAVDVDLRDGMRDVDVGSLVAQ